MSNTEELEWARLALEAILRVTKYGNMARTVRIHLRLRLGLDEDRTQAAWEAAKKSGQVTFRDGRWWAARS